MGLRQPGSRFNAAAPGRLIGLALIACACAGACCAQETPGGQRRVFSLVPSASVSETVTDNALLVQDKRSDAITTLNLGVNLVGNTRRVQGALDYQLSGSIYARESKANTTSNALSANGRAELIDNFMFLDANASIGQQMISAFGTQSRDVAHDANRSEVRSFNIRPSVQGRIGNWASYTASLGRVQQSSSSGQIGDSTTESASLTVNSATSGPLGWGLNAARQRYDFSAGRQSTVDSLRATLRYQLDADWRFSVNGGRERSDVLTDASSNSSIYGLGVEWVPNERTRLSAQRDHRFFGNAHNVSFDYRLPRMVVHFGSSRDVSAPQRGFANAGAVSLFDLLYANLAAVQPDPVLRQLLVQQELARLGLSPTAQVSTGFLTSALTLVSRQDLSLAWQGIRTTLTLSLHRSDSRRLDQAVNPADDFSSSENIRQRGLNVSLTYRLTAASGLSLSYGQDRNRGDLANQETDLRSLTLNWSSQLGPRSNASLGARRVESDSKTTPYTESAVFASLSVRF